MEFEIGIVIITYPNGSAGIIAQKIIETEINTSKTGRHIIRCECVANANLLISEINMVGMHGEASAIFLLCVIF